MSELELLKNVRIFEGLSEEEIKTVRKIMLIKKYPANSMIIREGEEGDEMFIISSGLVEISQTLTLKVSRESYDTKDKTLVKLGAKDHVFFGEIALLESSQRTATVKAAENCELFVINKSGFDEFCSSNPKTGYMILRNISKVVCARLRKANNDILKLTTALSIALSKK